MNICFIGTGNMAGAIIRGLSKEKSFSIYGYDLSEKALEVLYVSSLRNMSFARNENES